MGLMRNRNGKLFFWLFLPLIIFFFYFHLHSLSGFRSRLQLLATIGSL